ISGCACLREERPMTSRLLIASARPLLAFLVARGRSSPPRTPNDVRASSLGTRSTQRNWPMTVPTSPAPGIVDARSTSGRQPEASGRGDAEGRRDAPRTSALPRRDRWVGSPVPGGIPHRADGPPILATGSDRDEATRRLRGGGPFPGATRLLRG